MASDYPTPYIVEPQVLPHKQTFILLHGRGSSGENFGRVLLESVVARPAGSSSPDNGPEPILASAFPHARFVFPTAARRRATIYKRALTHQWFNNWRLDPPATDREDLQTPGLCESTLYLHQLLEKEIDLVPGGAKNVIFGGLSQGCAASLTALLLWEGPAVGAAIGMCGWLPYAARLREYCKDFVDEHQEGNDDGVFDPFAREDADGGSVADPTAQAISWLRDEMQRPKTKGGDTLAFKDVPLFLGHGELDDRVNVVLGQEGAQTLSGLGMSVSWNEYGDLGHWYSPRLLRDMVDFIKIQLEADK